MDCLFCKIDKGELPADIIYRDDFVIAFPDINPHAPHHLLIVPHKHIATLNDLTDDDDVLIGKMAHAAKVLAKRLKVQDEGYRLVMNCNKGAGQTVFHIHMHFLGGRDLNWPPG
jgi:histidine triad (HIT) family protein